MRVLLVLPALLAFAACGPSGLPPLQEPAGPVIKQVTLADVGLDPAAMNNNVNPCDDFYGFACGGWEAATEIPADQPRWMRSFSEIHKRNEEDLRDILAAAAQGSADPGTNKLGDFYAGCMDEAAVDAADWRAALGEMWRAIDSLAPAADDAPPAAPADVAAVIATLHRAGIWALFSISSTQDRKNATQTIAQIDQAGLGLPDRDYYLDDTPNAAELRAFYVGHVERMLSHIAPEGDADWAKRGAETVMRIETELAKASKTRTERRRAEEMYNKIDRQGLIGRTQGFAWEAYLSQLGLGSVNDINVTSVVFVDGVGQLLQSLAPADLRIYLSWHVLHAAAPSLPSRFEKEDFALQQKLFGAAEQKPRWKRCVAAADDALGELLAQHYVAKRFAPESKQAVQQMVAAVGRAFRHSLNDNTWMDEPTREAAAAKLDKMAFLIGYPDSWKRYDFPVSRDAHAGNVLRASQWEVQRDLGKIGKPIDRGEWFMTPPTVNAYYSASRNQMVFPAGILQPPFFDSRATVAVNMGGMGMVVGHELTHGFDDEGSKFDGNGNLSGWWGPEVRARFEDKTACVHDQYAGYEVLPGVKLNGKLTLGENIADAGGVKLAFAAYRSLRQDRGEVFIADGYTEDQQFFLSVAQVWCFKYREEYARARAKTDPHSQPNWRVNGALRNTPAFAEAFQCPAGSPMNPPDACGVW